MSLQPSGYHHPQQQVLYRADNNTIHNLRTVRDKLHNICRVHGNQSVRIETLDGQVYVGRIVGCNGGLMYLKISSQGGQRSPYSNDEMILTLVLYELLVITLLYT
ncbi:hypothetical protein A8L34_05825 [Bacillus sp. FJAT-27264]|uniref:hypothetical protein n=1 Tax=Paenibacillus sp. (strain DSM 101736 / FJAT-27264) TaxID=1850362 RepID=UPI000807B39B|nr:hypothetical protein [Bacillus sp. FJAT-27264]OBZ19055.1 hypothetical protein A8L34_05825 [Bacillus sp. FJAT-27264]